MSQQFFPLAGCQQSATERRAALANSQVRLFKANFIPTVSSQLAEYQAAECDYDGYAPITVAQWNPPILAPGSGFMIGSPLVQFNWTQAANGVSNAVGGAFVVDNAGRLRMTVVFSQPVAMSGPGAGLPLNLIDYFPTGV